MTIYAEIQERPSASSPKIHKAEADGGKDGINMYEGTLYPNIHQTGTGIYLKILIRKKGYTVKDIQRLLHLSCPQPVYRWFKGQVLPSVDHLYALSKLLYMHMENLLLPRREQLPEGMRLRLMAYYESVR